MGLISKTAVVTWNGNNKQRYVDKGYEFTKLKDKFEVKVEDLSVGAVVLVDVKCDCEDCKSPMLKTMGWINYVKYVKKDGKYYCDICKLNKYYKNRLQVQINTGNSFQDWCYKNLTTKEAEEILLRWDYDLNKLQPSEASYTNKTKYWFKCERNIHKSESKCIYTFTGGLVSGYSKSILCKKCNSFAQYLIDLYGGNALNLYWDYEKNVKLGLNPWEISKNSNKKVWIKCINKSYHESYNIICANFINGDRCAYCSNKHGKVHSLDSLGTLFPQVLIIWSDKNKKASFNYSPQSRHLAWWKCSEGKHEDYSRKIQDSYKCNFHCPKCNKVNKQQLIK